MNIFRVRLDPSQTKALLADRRPTTYPAQVNVYPPRTKQDRIYFLASGRVKLVFRDWNDDEKVVELVHPGRFFGISAVFGRHSCGVAAVTLTTCRIYLLSLSDVTQWVKANPAPAFSLLESMANTIWKMGHQLCSLSFMDARGIVAQTLMDWLEAPEVTDHSVGGAEGSAAAVAQTQVQLSGITGLSRVTISKVLRAFEDEGVVRKRRGGIEIVDRPALSRVAMIETGTARKSGTGMHQTFRTANRTVRP